MFNKWKSAELVIKLQYKIEPTDNIMANKISENKSATEKDGGEYSGQFLTICLMFLSRSFEDQKQNIDMQII